jgi:2-polyprenyl-6-methoxyphenol hydroxylase-like FAD-dependent oxidoreductase
LQKVLHDAAREAGIPIHFNKRVISISDRDDGLTEIAFEDGTRRLTEVLFAADGSRSQVREEVAGKISKLKYTGVTCLMGTADLPRESRGICFPSSITTQCHGCFFPTSEKEQCFQFHFSVPEEEAVQDGWGTLSDNVGKEECRKLAAKLREDGWDEKYLGALENVRMAIKTGVSFLEPQLKHFVYGAKGRVVLLGDAAHPPVPYIGQGAQQGIEDAGVIMMLLKNLCVDGKGNFDLINFGPAMGIYEKMRVPRTAEILNNANIQGRMQQKRAESVTYNRCKEELIKRDIFFHETMPVMFPGARYDYKAAVENVLKEKPLLSVLEEES